MRSFKSGTPMQGGLVQQTGDNRHFNITYPVLGVIQSVYFSDDNLNPVANAVQNGRGSAIVARVIVLNDGSESPTVLPNVTILPTGSSGHDDYQEEIPKAATGTIDGARFQSDFRDIPPWKLNGDWCVVGFIGGSIHQPVMLNWFPHPGNRKDPATGGFAAEALAQGRRWVKRFQGARLTITSKGTLFVDTSKANNKISDTRTSREENEEGGDINVTVKKDRKLEINFNPLVFDENEPDFLWERPEIDKKGTRDESNSRLIMDKDTIQILAGQVAEILASQNLYLGEQGASENLVLGQQLKSLLEKILNALLTHRHPTGVGPSGPPLPPELTEFTDALSTVTAEDILASWAFTQKDPP